MKVGVVLVGIEGRINLGFILRLARNFSVDEIVLVQPRAELEHEETQRFAAHGWEWKNRVRVSESLEEALREYEVSICTSAKVGQRSDVLRHPIMPWEIKERVGTPRSLALVFGRESTGLTREEIAKCDLLLHIPGNPDYPVLNLSHAVAIVLYEVWKQYKMKGEVVEVARKEDIDMFLKAWEKISLSVVDEERARKSVLAMKRIIHKARPTLGEIRLVNLIIKRVERLIESCLR